MKIKSVLFIMVLLAIVGYLVIEKPFGGSGNPVEGTYVTYEPVYATFRTEEPVEIRVDGSSNFKGNDRAAWEQEVRSGRWTKIEEPRKMDR